MKKIKKALLVLIMILTIIINTFSTYSEPSDWALDSIEVLLNNGFIQEEHVEDRKIKSNISREEFADLVVKLYSRATQIDIENIPMDDPFSDTDNPMVLRAYSLGIVNGISNTLFAPSDEITRQEIAKMLISALDLLSVDTTVHEEARFDDMNKVASWAKNAIDFSAQEGILRGMDNNLIQPLSFTTWEQTIVLFDRIINKYDFFEDTSLDDEVVETTTEISWEDYEIQKNGYIIPKATNLLVENYEDLGLHLRLIAQGNEGNRDLNTKIEELFEILFINDIPKGIIEEFRVIIDDTWTAFNAPLTSEPIVKSLDNGKRIELNCDLDVRISIYTPFLDTDFEGIPTDSFTMLPTGYMTPKDSELLIRTNEQLGTKLEVTIFDDETTAEIINKLNQLFSILKINGIPTEIIEKVERDITSNWNYNLGKPGRLDPEWEEIPNGDQLLYSSNGFVQIKIFSY